MTPQLSPIGMYVLEMLKIYINFKLGCRDVCPYGCNKMSRCRDVCPWDAKNDANKNHNCNKQICTGCVPLKS